MLVVLGNDKTLSGRHAVIGIHSSGHYGSDHSFKLFRKYYWLFIDSNSVFIISYATLREEHCIILNHLGKKKASATFYFHWIHFWLVYEIHLLLLWQVLLNIIVRKLNSCHISQTLNWNISNCQLCQNYYSNQIYKKYMLTSSAGQTILILSDVQRIEFSYINLIFYELLANIWSMAHSVYRHTHR